MTETEMCWRCPTPLEWRHGTWQCPSCAFKLGCCEGDPQTPCDVAVDAGIFVTGLQRTIHISQR